MLLRNLVKNSGSVLVPSLPVLSRLVPQDWKGKPCTRDWNVNSVPARPARVQSRADLCYTFEFYEGVCRASCPTRTSSAMKHSTPISTAFSEIWANRVRSSSWRSGRVATRERARGTRWRSTSHNSLLRRSSSSGASTLATTFFSTTFSMISTFLI